MIFCAELIRQYLNEFIAMKCEGTHKHLLTILHDAQLAKVKILTFFNLNGNNNLPLELCVTNMSLMNVLR